MAKLISVKNNDQIWDMLSAGQDEAIRDYISRIEFHPKQVLLFEKVYDEHIGACCIDDWVGSYPEEDVFEAEISDSLDDLRLFIADMPAYRNLGLFLNFFNHGGNNVTVEFGWIDGGAGAGPVIWDRWQGSLSSPVLAFSDIAYNFEHKDYQCVPRPKTHADPPMYRYHPERYSFYRTFADKLGGIYHKEADPRSGLITITTMQKIGDLACNEMNNKSVKFPRRHKDNLPSPTLIMDVEASLAMAYGRFVQAGKNIIDFPPELTEMLANTDVENIPMKSVRLPFASQYLYFGQQSGIEMAPGWFVDGAYVESRGESGDIRFSVTTVPTDHSLSSLWYVRPEAYYSQDFIETYRDSDLAQAIDGVLAETVNDLLSRQIEAGGDITDYVREKAEQEGVPLNIPESVTVVDVSPKNAGIRLEKALQQHPFYRAALRLVVNGLCYLTAYPDDISLAWPSGTPKGLMEKAASQDSKVSSKAKSKLATMGYTPIHICGKRVAEQRETAGIPSENHVAAHWRRGHWRNQAYGAGFSLRKLIWVMPALIGSTNDHGELPGHLYLIDTPDLSNGSIPLERMQR